MTTTIPDDIDPQEYRTVEAFKYAFYDEVNGIPSTLDDLKLTVVWKMANDVALKDHELVLVGDDD